ncbi:MAG: hypothetical protein M1839_000996 [Geoglossum umbratile]|nr:MAG: hypothetical protein M1839_000996 [Geoglossum umbratile]
MLLDSSKLLHCAAQNSSVDPYAEKNIQELPLHATKMSDNVDCLEREELLSNAACIGEDIGPAEIGNAAADRSGPAYALSDECVFSHMGGKCTSPQQQLSGALQHGGDEDRDEDEEDDELTAFFENYPAPGETSQTASPQPPFPHLPAPATLAELQLDTATTTHSDYSPSSLSSPFAETSSFSGVTIDPDIKLSPLLETYLSREERYELLIMGRM